MPLKFFIFPLIFLLCFKSLEAQNCNIKISGIIKDLHDSSPIFGAVVRINGSDTLTQTSEDGLYFFNQICPGKLIFVVEHSNCNSVQREVIVSENTTLNFTLEHHINELEEIIISDNALKSLKGSAKESRLNSDQINKYSSQSLADALNTLAGVSTLKTGNSVAKPMIHGMYGSRVGIVANGIRLQDQEWGADHAPTIDLNGFENIQLVKGASALKYGGDTPGGIIVLSPSKLILKDSLFGQTIINASENGRGGSISTKIMKTTSDGYYVSSQFSGKQFGDLQAPEYILSNTGVKQMNISLKLGRSKILSGWEVNYSRFQNEIGILRGAHIGNIQDLLRALKTDEPLRIDPFTYLINSPKQEGVHQNFHFTYFNQTSNKVKWQLDYNYQANTRKEFDIRRGIPATTPAIDLKLQTHNFLVNLKWKTKFSMDYEWGVNGILQDNYSNPNTGVKRLIPDYLRYQMGSYFLGAYSPSNSFSWDWGIRLDQNTWDVQKFYNVSDWEERDYAVLFPDFDVQQFGNKLLVNPKLNFLTLATQTGISIILGEQFSASLTYVLSQRSPNASELFSDGLHHSLATLEYGSLSLEKEISNKILLNFSKNKGRFKGTLEPYVSKISNYIFIGPTGIEQTIRGAFPVWQYDTTNASFWGVDAGVDYTFSEQLTFDINASYTYAQDLINSQPLISIPPFNSSQILKYTSPKKKFDLELVNHFVAFQNRFPEMNFTVNTLQDGLIIEELVDISTPPSAYQSIDFNFSIYFNLIKQSTSSISFIVNNITQTKYRDYLNRMRFYADDIGRNFQLQFIFSY